MPAVSVRSTRGPAVRPRTLPPGPLPSPRLRAAFGPISSSTSPTPAARAASSRCRAGRAGGASRRRTARRGTARVPRAARRPEDAAAALFAGARHHRFPVSQPPPGLLVVERTILRAETTGRIRRTPSSVAFCSVQSMRSAARDRLTSVTASATPRARRSAQDPHAYAAPPIEATSARKSLPEPSNSTAGRPVAASARAPRAAAAVAGKLQLACGSEAGPAREPGSGARCTVGPADPSVRAVAQVGRSSRPGGGVVGTVAQGGGFPWSFGAGRVRPF